MGRLEEAAPIVILGIAAFNRNFNLSAEWLHVLLMSVNC